VCNGRLHLGSQQPPSAGLVQPLGEGIGQQRLVPALGSSQQLGDACLLVRSTHPPGLQHHKRGAEEM